MLDFIRIDLSGLAMARSFSVHSLSPCSSNYSTILSGCLHETASSVAELESELTTTRAELQSALASEVHLLAELQLQTELRRDELDQDVQSAQCELLDDGMMVGECCNYGALVVGVRTVCTAACSIGTAE